MPEATATYDEYRDSGQPWLGDVPAHWRLVRNKALFREQTAAVGNSAKDYKLLSLTLGGVIPRDMENPKGKFPAEFDTYKKVAPDDLVFCLFDVAETPRAVGRADEAGMITGAYTILRANADVNSRYLTYYYLSLDYDKRLSSLYTGLRNVIKIDTFMSIKTPVPDLDTQNRIVKFLDEKTAEIDAAIEKKRRLIDLLNEQKAILINRAVTKGLNPNAPMKDSGVAWIGEIPAHWDVLRNQHFLQQRKVVVGKKSDDYTLLSLTLRGIIERDMENPEGKFPAEFDTYQIVRSGDFVFCHFDVEETPRTVGLSRFGGMITGAYTVYESLRSEYSEYTERFYVSLDRKKQLRPLYTGLRNTIDKTTFAHTKMPVPPPEELANILAWIAEREADSDQVIEATKREITTLNEFKQTLIANAVTGKIKI